MSARSFPPCGNAPSVEAVARLDHGEKPGQPADAACAGGAVVTRQALSCMLGGAAGGKPMSIDAEEAAIRTVIVGTLMGHSEADERSFDALFAMRQAEAIVKALKIGGYEIKRVSR
jgi:hypothetical protein